MFGHMFRGYSRGGCRWATGSGFQKVFFDHLKKVAEEENQLKSEVTESS